MKKHSLIILNFLFLVLAGSTISCKKNNFADHVGPSICPTEQFKITEEPAVSYTTINLNTQVQVMTAAFNEDVPWTVVVRGTVSKSFKKFSGYGKTINVKWKGNPDTLAFFKTELCNVEFKIACKDAIVKPFTIGTLNNFANFDYLIYSGDGGALAGGPYMYGAYVATPGSQGSVNGLGSPQGGFAMNTTGYSTTPQWFFGGYDFTMTLGSNINADPTKVYFNCFVNTQGSVGTIPVVTFKEGTVQRSKNIVVENAGWHYVSFPLSDCNVVNPRNINTVSFGLNSYPTRVTGGRMCIDFVSFTNDSPFISQ